MTFNSLHFLIFLPAVIILYFVLPHKVRWILLLAASYYAYMSWNAWLIFPIMGTTLISYLAAIMMNRTENKSMKKFFLIITLVVCLGTLVFFKYFNFLLDNVINLFNLFSMNLESAALDIILPVGISFYTFQTLSYVIDVYRGKFPPEKHLGYYALYVSYFPQLVAGPIERPENLLPQLKEKQKANKEDITAGLRIMAVGYFRKCVIADFLGLFVNSVFADINSANSLAVLTAGALFAVQLYCDFAGYSEIAVGAARIMGIKLAKNFDRPYSATSMRDFIRRWHITLNTWFKDYLYIPLGGNRKGKARQIFSMFLVYALCGLWHGANWTFLLWGLYVAGLMTAEIFLRKPYRRLCEKCGIDNNGVVVIMLRRIVVFLLCTLGALIFRSESIEQIGGIFIRLFTAIGFGTAYFDAALSALSMNVYDIIRLALVLVCMLKLYDITDCRNCTVSAPLLCPADKSEERFLAVQQATALLYAVIAIALGWLMLIAGDNVSAFVYFQF